MASDIQKNQGSPAKPGVDSHDPQNRDPNNMMEHVKVRNQVQSESERSERQSESNLKKVSELSDKWD